MSIKRTNQITIDGHLLQSSSGADSFFIEYGLGAGIPNVLLICPARFSASCCSESKLQCLSSNSLIAMIPVAVAVYIYISMSTDLSQFSEIHLPSLVPWCQLICLPYDVNASASSPRATPLLDEGKS